LSILTDVRADIPWPEVVRRLAQENEKLARRPQGHNGEYFVVCTLYYTPMESGFTFERGFNATPVTRPGLRGRKYPRDFLVSVRKEGFGGLRELFAAYDHCDRSGIRAYGGEIRLQHRVEHFETNGRRVTAALVATPEGERRFEAEHLISTLSLQSLVRAFGDQAFIQRCTEHKVRNVEEYLHKDERSWVTRVMRKAYKRTDPELARRDLEALARRLEETNIDAAASLREGMDETLTIHGLGVGQMLARTLRTTNALESMNEIIRTRTRNVKHWQGGDMPQRWAAAAMLEAESQFRRVQGWKELPALARALYHATVLKQEHAGGTTPEIAA